MSELQIEFDHKRKLLLEHCTTNSLNSYPYEIAYQIETLHDPCCIKTCISALFALTQMGYDAILRGKALFSHDKGYMLIGKGLFKKHELCENEIIACTVLHEFLERCLEDARKYAIAKKLPIYDNWCGADTLVNPHAFFTWAKSKGYTLPQELETWLDIQPPAPIPCTEGKEPAPQDDKTVPSDIEAQYKERANTLKKGDKNKLLAALYYAKGMKTQAIATALKVGEDAGNMRTRARNGLRIARTENLPCLNKYLKAHSRKEYTPQE